MNFDWPSVVHKLRHENRSFVVATIVGVTGHTPREVGAKMIIENSAEQRFHGTIGGGMMEKEVIADAIEILKTGKAGTKEYDLTEKNHQACGGKATVFFEFVRNETELYLFGAGHVAQALIRVLQNTPFKIILVDERPEWTNSTSITSDSVERHVVMWDVFLKERSINPQAYVVIMTYDHKHDYSILREVLKRDLKYVGAVGSKNKSELFRKKLLEEGLDRENVENLKLPIGIEIRGKAPSEIAISIAAQLLQKYYNE